MPFALFVALRYLRDARGQTVLILAAVAVGVSVIVFLSALITGLQTSLVESTLGSQPHLVLRVPREAPRPVAVDTDGRRIARLVQPAGQRLRSIDQWPVVVREIGALEAITAMSPTVTGTGIATRADAHAPVIIRGIEPDRFLAIIDIRARMIEGTFDLSGGRVVVGAGLADDLGVSTGDTIRLSSSEGVDDIVVVAGLFRLGSDAVDGSWIVTSLRHAQSLFALSGGVTTIEATVADVFAADAVAAQVRARTPLVVESWMQLNENLLAGLSAQRSSRIMIQFFVVVSVALGIASVLIVSVVQRSREIGILRAVGTPSHRVQAVFLIQGGLLGFGGALIGLVLGIAFAQLFEQLARNPDGTPRFPVQVDLELLAGATLLATVVGVAAAVLPARRAARLDPATAIRHG